MTEISKGQLKQLFRRGENGVVDFDLFQEILEKFRLIRALLAVDLVTLRFFLDNLGKVRELMVGSFTRIVINFGLGLEGMKKAGKYDWVDPDINEERVKLEGTGEVEEDVVLLDLGREISTNDAEAEILARRLEPSTIAAGFAYTVAHPELKDVTIVCLGSVVVSRAGNSCSPHFDFWSDKHGVDLAARVAGWDQNCSFLCSRKRSPA